MFEFPHSRAESIRTYDEIEAAPLATLEGDCDTGCLRVEGAIVSREEMFGLILRGLIKGTDEITLAVGVRVQRRTPC